MCLAGRVASHADALAWGLSNELVPAEDLAGRAQQLGQQLASGAVSVLGPTRRLLRARSMAGYEAHLKEEAETIASMAGSADTRERLRTGEQIGLPPAPRGRLVPTVPAVQTAPELRPFAP